VRNAVQELSGGAVYPVDLPRTRPLWKTLLVAAVIGYSPLVAVFVVILLTAGSLAQSGDARVLFGGLTLVSGAIAAVLYFVAAGIAVIYIDRRREPETFDFWSAFGSVLLFYLAVMLPFVLIVVLAITLGVVGGRS
jgi:hypothetical protein